MHRYRVDHPELSKQKEARQFLHPWLHHIRQFRCGDVRAGHLSGSDGEAGDLAVPSGDVLVTGHVDSTIQEAIEDTTSERFDERDNKGRIIKGRGNLPSFLH